MRPSSGIGELTQFHAFGARTVEGPHVHEFVDPVRIGSVGIAKQRVPECSVGGVKVSTRRYVIELIPLQISRRPVFEGGDVADLRNNRGRVIFKYIIIRSEVASCSAASHKEANQQQKTGYDLGHLVDLVVEELILDRERYE